MKSLDQIKSIMRIQGAYYWVLQLLENRREVSLGAFDDGGGDDAADKAADKKDKIGERSMKRLEDLVETMENESAVFSIILRKTKNSHENGVLGPFEFTSSGVAKKPQEQQQLQGVPGLGSMNQEAFDRAVKAEAGAEKVTFQMQQLAQEKAEFEAYKKIKTEQLEESDRRARERANEIIESAKSQCSMIIELQKSAWENEKALDRKLLAFEKEAWQKEKDAGPDMMPILKDGMQTLQAIFKGQQAAPQQLAGTERTDPLFIMVDRLCEELMQCGDLRIVAQVGYYFAQLKQGAAEPQPEVQT
jgi:hypothetical protein